MLSLGAKRVFMFLSENILNRIETISEARQFVAKLDGLSETDRVFLDVALTAVATLQDCRDTFDAREPAHTRSSVSRNSAT